jgi:hypothetical protein
MINRRVRRPFVRRFLAGLMAAVVGGVGSLAMAAPSHADGMPCRVDFSDYASSYNPQHHRVTAYVHNTGSVTSTGWVVYAFLPPDTVIDSYAMVDPMPEYGPGWFSARETKAIRPGHVVSFYFTYTVPPGVDGALSEIVCSIF